MAVISFDAGNDFSLISEGKHVFRIYDVDDVEEYKNDPDLYKRTIIVHMVIANGKKHKETYHVAKNGKMVPAACNAFGFLAHVALHDFTLDGCEAKDIIGCYIGAEVKHSVVDSNKGDGSKVTFMNLGNKWQVDGWDEEPSERTKNLFKKDDEVLEPEEEDDFDYDSILSGLED